jgi:hypothetical protein
MSCRNELMTNEDWVYNSPIRLYSTIQYSPVLIHIKSMKKIERARKSPYIQEWMSETIDQSAQATPRSDGDVLNLCSLFACVGYRVEEKRKKHRARASARERERENGRKRNSFAFVHCDRWLVQRTDEGRWNDTKCDVTRKSNNEYKIRGERIKRMKWREKERQPNRLTNELL